jgi:hypothetical protein
MKREPSNFILGNYIGSGPKLWKKCFLVEIHQLKTFKQFFCEGQGRFSFKIVDSFTVTF